MSTQFDVPDVIRRLQVERGPFPGRRVVQPRQPLSPTPSPTIDWDLYGTQAFGFPMPGRERQFAFSPVNIPPLTVGTGDDNGDDDGKDKDKKAKEQIKGLFDFEDKSIKTLKDKLAEYEKKKSKVDLSPMLALTDSLTGSQLSRYYDRPMTEEERDQVVFQLKQAVEAKEADVDYKKARLQSYKAERIARAAEKKEERDLRLKIAKLNIEGKEKSAQRQETRLKKFLANQPGTRKTLDTLAAEVTRGRKGEENYEIYAPLIHDRLYEVGKYWEEEGKVPEGTGYTYATKQILDAASQDEETFRKTLEAYAIPGWDLPAVE